MIGVYVLTIIKKILSPTRYANRNNFLFPVCNNTLLKEICQKIIYFENIVKCAIKTQSLKFRQL